MTSLPERFLTEVRRRTFGFVFQHFNLVRGLSALENAMLPAYPTGEKLSVLRKRALDLFDLLDLRPKAGTSAECLSGGEAQRAAIARALINNPAVVIADEPTAHLDTTLSLEFIAIAGRLKDAGKTVLIASHDPLVSESPLVDRVFNLRDGRIGDSGR
jgi:putative ABC transport system ATP-binding protein